MRGDKGREKKISKVSLSDDVILDINMFSSAVKLRILDKAKSTLIIGEERCRRGWSFTKASKQMSMPDDFFCGRGGS